MSSISLSPLLQEDLSLVAFTRILCVPQVGSNYMVSIVAGDIDSERLTGSLA